MAAASTAAWTANATVRSRSAYGTNARIVIGG
jgi:hypothetical protein